MTDLAEALELMHTSIGRWQTLQCAGREWRHPARSMAAFQRYVGQRRGGGFNVVSIGSSDGKAEPEETEEAWRLWLAKPDRSRAEFRVGAETVTVVIAGDIWWSWSATGEGTTNAGDPHQGHGTGPGQELIEPATLLPAVELEVMGSSRFLERPVLKVVATPSRPEPEDADGSRWLLAAHGLGVGADAYHLLVDAERGTLLRAEATVGGEPFRILEMDAIAFDEDLPAPTFSPASSLRLEELHSPRDLSLAELPGAVPFVVLVPEHPPFGPPRASVEPASRRLGHPLQVRLDYASPMVGDEGRRFWLTESAEPASRPPGC